MARRFDEHVILKTLDNQPRILFWELDEFLVMTVPVMLGIGVGSFLLMISGFIAKPFYSKIKRCNRRRRQLLHTLYWNLPHSTFVQLGALKRLPPSHKRELTL